MSYAKQLLEDQLAKLNASYNQFVTLGEVLPTSNAAIDNRQKVADIEAALSHLAPIFKTNNIPDNIISVVGHSIDNDDMQWTVDCPGCQKELQYAGFFDKDDLNICKQCGTKFKTSRIEFDNGDHIE